MRIATHFESFRCRVVLLSLVAVVWLAGSSPLFAQRTQTDAIPASAERTAFRLDVNSRLPAPSATHPLVPAYELAMECLGHVRRDIRDYSCLVIRRERVDGVLRDFEYMQAKVRHQRSRNGQVVIPFSVYLKVLKPSKIKGREILYVDGQYGNKMFVRNGGRRFAFVTTQVDPASELALRDNRYSITDFGVQKLVERLAEVAREDMAVGDDCRVRFLNDAKVNGRECLGLEVVHPQRDERFRFHIARIFVDDELQIPIHYESYDWPEEADGAPVLLEQYTYSNIQLNNGLTDADFAPDTYKLD